MLEGALKKSPVGLPAELELSTETMSRSWLVGRSGSRTGLNSNEGTTSPFSNEEDVFCTVGSSFWEVELFVADVEVEGKGENPNASQSDSMHLGLWTNELRAVSPYTSVEVVTSFRDSKWVSSSNKCFSWSEFWEAKMEKVPGRMND